MYVYVAIFKQGIFQSGREHTICSDFFLRQV